MKAMVLQKTGGVENLIKTDIPVPVINAQEVLVKVRSISINPVDVFVRASENALQYVLHPEANEKPIILGWDISGVVVEAGSAVRKFRTGDEVFGMVNFMGQGRAYAGYVAAPESHLALKPKNIPHQEAAAATLAALTAYQSLITYAKVKPGEKVIIHAAAGGVGHFAVQIAKQLGAHVIGIASGENKHFVLGLGADEFIDYKTQVFEELVEDADVIVDSVNDPAHIERSLNALGAGGRLISLLTFFSDEFHSKLKAKNASGHRLVVTSDGGQMAEIAAWLEKGVLRSHVSREFSFDDLPLAHLQIETRKTRGKIVVNL